MIFQFVILANIELVDKFELSKGKNCSEVRLDLPPEAMSKIPIQHQQDLGLCAAYSATQLADAWKIKNDPPLEFITSPYPLALQHSISTGRNMFQNGASPYSILEKINEYKACSYNTFNKNLKTKNYEIFLEDLLAAQSKQTRSEMIAEINKCIQKAGFNNKLDLDKLSNHLIEDNKLKNINIIIQDLCSKEAKIRTGFPKPESVAVSSKGEAIEGIKKIRKIIDERLNNKRTPVSINYCHGMLKNVDLITMQKNGTLSTESCPTAMHGSPIVGRRVSVYTDPVTKTKTPFCQYLVRDSYGTSCDKFPNENDMSPSDKCVNGQIWVDEINLFLNTSEIVYLKDKEEAM